jgi:hypothetical protein
MHGVHQDGNIGQEFGDLLSRFETIHHRHHQIENDEMGFQFLRFGNGFLTIVDVHNFPGPRDFQKGTQGSSNRGTVFSNQNSDGHANRQARRVAPHGLLFRKGMMPYELTTKPHSPNTANFV